MENRAATEHEHVGAIEIPLDVPGKRVNVLVTGPVGRIYARTASTRIDLSGDFLERIWPSRHQAHLSAPARQAQSDCPADAPAGSCDDRNFFS
jgi:hypothetical protein